MGTAIGIGAVPRSPEGEEYKRIARAGRHRHRRKLKEIIRLFHIKCQQEELYKADLP